MTEEQGTNPPGIPMLFLASVAASGIVFLATILFLGTLAMFSNNPGPSLLALLYGSIYALVIVLAATFILIAPLGTAFGLALQRLAPPGPWHGAVVGALIAAILVTWHFSQAGLSAQQDGGNLAMIAIFVAVSAGAGWIVQRHILRWPD